MSSITSAVLRAGIAKRIRKALIIAIHTNSGRRLMVMPGARRVKVVTMILMADAIEPIPVSSRATAQ